MLSATEKGVTFAERGAAKEPKAQWQWMENVYGDLMLMSLGTHRFLRIDAETALEKTNRKFINRFQQMEELANQRGKNLDEMNLQEMDEIWNEIKSKKQNP